MDPIGGDVTAYDRPSQRLYTEARDEDHANSRSQRISTSSIMDHYRAVPLSDGCHVLYTDPRTGTLSLGSDAPEGCLNRLICKAQFRPPINTSSTLPVLYTVGSDTRLGVCVMATFAVDSGDNSLGEDASTRPFNLDPSTSSDTDKQMIVFYMIPPDVFTVISRTRCRQHCMNVTQHKKEGNLSEKMDSRPKGSYNNIDSGGDHFAEVTAYPVEIRGQPVAICRNLVELALDLGPDMILWVFSTQGWAQAWALRPGREDATRTVVQADGSLRQVDSKGDYIMTEVDQAVAAPDVSFKSLTSAEMALKMKTDTTALIPPAEQFHRFATRIPGETSRRMVSVQLMDELNGIARVDVELG